MAFGDSLTGLSERLLAERKEQAALGEARRLVQALRSAGHVVALVEPDGIRISPRPDAAMTEIVKAAKPHLLTVLRAQAPK